MASTYLFQHGYGLQPDAGNSGSFTVVVDLGGSYTVTDTPDSGDDTTRLGDVSPDTFHVSNAAVAFTYGGTAAGHPTVFGTIPAGYYQNSDYIFSDNAYVLGSHVSIVNQAFTLCFSSGVLIATPSGEQAVETLAIGDLVRTRDGRAVPVKWVGRQQIGGVAAMAAGREPVRIEAGALGEGLPARDLVVTSDHALLLDGVLVQAGALVNGTTIARLTQAELRSGLTVFHLETEAHEIVLAEGVPAETFVDNVTRRAFDNYDEFEALYGPVADAVVERDEPRAMSARQVPASVRARIAGAVGERLPVAA